jgi:hypothetical protein
VRGLNELVRDFGRLEKGLKTEVQSEIRGLVAIVAGEARTIAGRKFQSQTGDAIQHIKTSVRGGRGFIVEDAEHRGYPYPRRLEYENGGVRAFMRPALEAMHDDVERELGLMLDRLFERGVSF